MNGKRGSNNHTISHTRASHSNLRAALSSPAAGLFPARCASANRPRTRPRADPGPPSQNPAASPSARAGDGAMTTSGREARIEVTLCSSARRASHLLYLPPHRVQLQVRCGGRQRRQLICRRVDDRSSQNLSKHLKHINHPLHHAPAHKARLTKQLSHPIEIVADALKLVLDLLLTLHRLGSIAGGQRLLG